MVIQVGKSDLITGNAFDNKYYNETIHIKHEIRYTDMEISGKMIK